jgi:hypothetical protein
MERPIFSYICPFRHILLEFFGLGTMARLIQGELLATFSSFKYQIQRPFFRDINILLLLCARQFGHPEMTFFLKKIYNIQWLCGEAPSGNILL